MNKFLNKIVCGDSCELIKQIPDKSIDLIVTDPPYDFMSKKTCEYTGAGAFGKMGRTYHGELEQNGLIDYQMDEKFVAELIRVMKKVNIYLWCNKEQIRTYLNFFKDYNMELLCWHKTNPVPTDNNKYLSDTEYLLFFRENGVKIYGSYETKKKYYISTTNKNDKELFEHATIKPLEIIKNLVINSSQPNDIVADFFMGSGTTAVACQETGRQFIGIEKNPKWCKIANDRLNKTDAHGQIGMFLR